MPSPRRYTDAPRRRRPDDVPVDAQQALTDLIAMRVAGRPFDELERDERPGPKAWRAMIEDTVTDILLAGWRPHTPLSPSTASDSVADPG
jgi:hypothetical protein